jgi:hypothetical protein
MSEVSFASFETTGNIFEKAEMLHLDHTGMNSLTLTQIGS